LFLYNTCPRQPAQASVTRSVPRGPRRSIGRGATGPKPGINGAHEGRGMRAEECGECKVERNLPQVRVTLVRVRESVNEVLERGENIEDPALEFWLDGRDTAGRAAGQHAGGRLGRHNWAWAWGRGAKPRDDDPPARHPSRRLHPPRQSRRGGAARQPPTRRGCTPARARRHAHELVHPKLGAPHAWERRRRERRRCGAVRPRRRRLRRRVVRQPRAAWATAGPRQTTAPSRP
jgi:hypothetical protein